MPQPPKITPQLVDAIVPCIRLRVSLRRIAAAAGITPTPLLRAIERGRQPGAPEHLVRLAENFDAVESCEEYWTHHQACAISVLESVSPSRGR